MANVLVGVGAGIAAYKVPYLVRSLKSAGHTVWVCPTEKSLHFVGEETWQALSGNPILRGPLSVNGTINHVEIARDLDLIVIAPATADLLARLRAGVADDMLTTTMLAADVPAIVAPAMHTNMWINPATVENVATLRRRNFKFVGPVSGALSSGDSGMGRMSEIEDIYRSCCEALETCANQDLLRGTRAVVTAGGTREPIDPVRYIANRSSGQQGIEIAKALASMGAEVLLIAGKCSYPLPSSQNITIKRAFSAVEMEEAVLSSIKDSQILVMTAAVADYRVAEVSDRKLKKEDWGTNPVLKLEQNPDILREVSRSEDRPELVVGFAAETGNQEQVLAFGKRKACAKGVDLLAINAVGEDKGFGDVPNEITVVDGQGEQKLVSKGTKTQVAQQLADLIASCVKNDIQEKE